MLFPISDFSGLGEGGLVFPSLEEFSPQFVVIRAVRGFGVGGLYRSEERRVGKEWKQCQTLFFWAPKSLQMVIAAMKLKDAYSLEGKL